MSEPPQRTLSRLRSEAVVAVVKARLDCVDQVTVDDTGGLSFGTGAVYDDGTPVVLSAGALAQSIAYDVAQLDDTSEREEGHRESHEDGVRYRAALYLFALPGVSWSDAREYACELADAGFLATCTATEESDR